MSNWTKSDFIFMERAFELANAQVGRTGKNPAVGCVIVSSSNEKLAEGVTGDGGSSHAEESALKLLSGRAENCKMYVTLEPCRQRSSSKTSCSALILNSGIMHVICAIEDRHPLGAGGIAFLQNAGVLVETGLLQDKAEKLLERLIVYRDRLPKI